MGAVHWMGATAFIGVSDWLCSRGVKTNYVATLAKTPPQSRTAPSRQLLSFMQSRPAIEGFGGGGGSDDLRWEKVKFHARSGLEIFQLSLN